MEKNNGIGARSVFEGTVRNINDGHEVKKLEYECYESLAIKEGDQILDEAIEKFDLIDAFCIHRVGTLEIGETAVIVVATCGDNNHSSFNNFQCANSMDAERINQIKFLNRFI